MDNQNNPNSPASPNPLGVANPNPTPSSPFDTPPQAAQDPTTPTTFNQPSSPWATSTTAPPTPEPALSPWNTPTPTPPVPQADINQYSAPPAPDLGLPSTPPAPATPDPISSLSNPFPATPIPAAEPNPTPQPLDNPTITDNTGLGTTFGAAPAPQSDPAIPTTFPPAADSNLNGLNTPPATPPLDTPWSTPSQPPVAETPPSQPTWTPPTPTDNSMATQTPEPSAPPIPDTPIQQASPVDTSAAPTDLSHLLGNNPPEETVQNANSAETLVVPPSSAGPTPDVPTLPTADHKPIPRWLFGVGAALLILVTGASAYFILGIGQAPQDDTTSLPAEVSTTTIQTPTPIATPPPATAAPVASGSANFGQLDGSGTQQATSAADLLRQRQQSGQQ